MINSNMVKGPILVKATRINTNDGEYYLEFQLNEGQKDGLVLELLLAHMQNNTLTNVVKHEYGTTENERKMDFLKGILHEHQDMPLDLRADFLRKILDLSTLTP